MNFFVLWFGVMFPLVFSPGPANIVFAASGAKVGVRGSLPLLYGIDLIFILKSMLIGFGFGGIIQQHPLFLQILQFFGTVYIVYLAIGFLKTSLHDNEQQTKILGFKDGVIIQLLNAKGWIMVLLMFSIFSAQAQDSFGDASIAMLILMLAVLNVSMHLVWIRAGEIITTLVGNDVNQKTQGFIYFFSLIFVAGWLFVDNPFFQH